MSFAEKILAFMTGELLFIAIVLAEINRKIGKR